ncbi:MAG: hypothetical protein ACT4O1_02270 [Gemmatimonadota bacterium]
MSAMRWRYLIGLLLLVFVVAGCAGGTGARPAKSAHPQSNRITAQEVNESARFKSAYEMIQSLRPHWIQTRGPRSFANRTAGQVMVYLDGTWLGTVEALRQIVVSHVQDMEHLNAGEATTRYGIDHSGGAILITTRRN